MANKATRKKSYIHFVFCHASGHCRKR